jgi:hypothetical protein
MESSTLGPDLTYRRPNTRDFTLDDNDLARACPLDNHKHHLQPKHGLGVLDTLPLEVLSLVLVHTDIRTLTDFRRINHRAMQVVDSVPEYRLVQQHTPDLLRGILSVEIGSHISTQTLFSTLNEYKCEGCGDFGSFIYLLTCERVCFLCLYEKPRYYPLLLSEAAAKFGTHRRLYKSLPSVKSVPGRYSPRKNTRKARFNLIDADSAQRIGLAFHNGSTAAMEQCVVAAHNNESDAWDKRVMAGYKVSQNPPRRRRQVIWVPEGRVLDPRRFMAVVRAPWINPSTNAVEWGFHCVGCKEKFRTGPLNWRRMYSDETFSLHIEECGRVCDGKHQLDGSLRIVG